MTMNHPRLPAAALAVALLTLVGCSSAPVVPSEALRAAEQAIGAADQARVADLAPAELKQAREKLTDAHAAVSEKDMVLALWLAEQSRADAELATARAGAIRAKSVNDEMLRSIEMLKVEMQRNSGAKQ